MVIKARQAYNLDNKISPNEVGAMLETRRLLLRNFDPLDAADVLEYTSQKQVAKDAGFMPCETLMQALFFWENVTK